MELYDQNGYPICQICGKSFKMINEKHLMKFHNIEYSEYKKKYNNTYPLRAGQIPELKKPIEEEIIKEEVKIESFDLDKIPVINKNEINDVYNFIEEVKSFSKDVVTTYPDPTGIIHSNKLKILNYLLTLFPLSELKNSYFVEKYSKSGFLEERLITDIVLIRRKINLEFPNTFWHNRDIPKENRDSKLRSMGYKIIDILGSKPSIEDVKSALKKFNLL